MARHNRSKNRANVRARGGAAGPGHPRTGGDSGQAVQCGADPSSTSAGVGWRRRVWWARLAARAAALTCSRPAFPEDSGMAIRIPILVVVVLGACVLGAAVAHARDYRPAECPVVANTQSGIYHTPENMHYRMMLKQNKNKKDNRKCFRTERDARAAGYRKSKVPVGGLRRFR